MDDTTRPASSSTPPKSRPRRRPGREVPPAPQVVPGSDAPPSAPAERGGGGAVPVGPLSSTGLLNCAGGVSLPGASLPDVVVRHPDPVSLDAVHVGFDTVVWHYRCASRDELDALLTRFAPLAGQDEAELVDFGLCRVRHVSKQYAFAVDTGFGLRCSIPRDERFPVMVTADPVFSLSVPADELQTQAEGFTAILLGLVPGSVKLVLSRVDVACDIVVSKADFDGFTSMLASKDPRIVTRARETAFYMTDGAINSVRVGKGDVVLRVYDKELEAEAGGDIAFWRSLWGGVALGEDEMIVRFEWQMRRGFLRQLRRADADGDGLASVSQFLASSGSVLEYLGLAWFRLADPARGRDHKRLTTAWWQGVVDAMRSRWYEFSPELWRDTTRKLCKDPELLFRMIGGCLASVSALLAAADERAAPLSERETLSALLGWLEENADDWRDRAAARRKRLYIP